eukprot:8433-Chlamydomonas_euryale.AAC.1
MHQFCISRDAGNARRRRRCQTLHTLEECSQLGGAEMVLVFSLVAVGMSERVIVTGTGPKKACYIICSADPALCSVDPIPHSAAPTPYGVMRPAARVGGECAQKAKSSMRIPHVFSCAAIYISLKSTPIVPLDSTSALGATRSCMFVVMACHCTVHRHNFGILCSAKPRRQHTRR